MKVETLIYAYLAVCVSMILFNIVCIFIFRKKDKNIKKRSIDFTDIIEAQLDEQTVDEKHKSFLRKKLKKINHMMAFDETLEKLYAERPNDIKKYIADISSVFVFLTFKYNEKNHIQAAYFPYIIKKYHVFKGSGIPIVLDSLMELVKEENMYCRENALQALYSIGDAGSVIEALKLLDRAENFHHGKMITDGLLCFSGPVDELNRQLWENFDAFSAALKQAILDYFRFSSGDHCEKMLQIMTDGGENQELRFSAIRYFAKYHYEPALAHLYSLATDDALVWEYRAIAASALGNYSAAQTEMLLKEFLCDPNWFVRYNAADSLERLGVHYEEMIDIFEGRDRYAAEMLRYRFDRKKLKETEGMQV